MKIMVVSLGLILALRIITRKLSIHDSYIFGIDPALRVKKEGGCANVDYEIIHSGRRRCAYVVVKV